MRHLLLICLALCVQLALGKAQSACAKASTLHTSEVLLLDIPAGLLRDAPASSTIELLSAPLTFRSVGSFMLVTASIDGKPGTFIIDSGAPGLILNRPVTGSDLVSGVTVGGESAFAKTQVATLAWGAVVQKDVTAYATDLDYLTETLGERVDGMLGYDQLSATPLTLDFVRREIVFHSGAYAASSGELELRLKLSGHVPTVRSTIDGRRLRLALDTGAGVNVLDDRELRRLDDDSHQPIDDMLLRGLGADYQRVRRSQIHLTEIESGNWINLPFAFTNISGFAEAGIRANGILGREWMSSHVVTLDYGQRRVWVR